jgi:hypothetical protein
MADGSCLPSGWVGEKRVEEKMPGRPWQWGAAGLLFVLGLLNVPVRVIGWDGDGLPGDGIDSVLNNYMLEHGYRWLRGQTHFWHAPFFYPTPGMTGTTDPHIGMLPIYALMRTVGLSAERAFQGWFLCAFVLNFATAWWAARQFGFAPLTAAAAAYVFTFALSVSAQLYHAQLFHRWLVPPTIVFAWYFLHQPTNRRFVLLVVCWFGQFLLSAYIGIFLAQLLVVLGVLVALRHYHLLPWRDLLWANRRVWLYRTAVVVAVAALLLSIGIRHARVTGPNDHQFLLWCAPEPRSWLVVPPHSLWSVIYRQLGIDAEDEEGERRLFAGWIPYLALLIGLGGIQQAARAGTAEAEQTRRRVAVALLGWSSLLLALWVTRWGSFWPYDLVMSVPGINKIRAVGRVVLVLLFPFGLAVAELLTRVLSRQRWWWKVFGGILVAVLVAEQTLLPTEEQHAWAEAGGKISLSRQVRWQEQLKAILQSHPHPRLVYVFPSELPPAPVLDHQHYKLQLLAMRATQDLGLPCINGYSGYFPLKWLFFRNYRDLFDWLLEEHQLRPYQLRGLVLVGEPEADDDPEYEGIMRQQYPPLPLPPWE